MFDAFIYLKNKLIRKKNNINNTENNIDRHRKEKSIHYLSNIFLAVRCFRSERGAFRSTLGRLKGDEAM